MSELAILCPTRSRPRECARMVESALTHSLADVLLYVDHDDPQRAAYVPLAERERVGLLWGPPVGRGEAVNRLVFTPSPQEHHRSYRLYLVVSDDIVFTRSGWEDQVREAMDSFGDDIGVVHLASETQERYVNWACISRRMIDTLGWFNQPMLKNFCQDTVLQVLAEAVGRITFIEPQVLRHEIVNHPDVEARLRADEHAFLWYMAKGFAADLAKLKAAINSGVTV